MINKSFRSLLKRSVILPMGLLTVLAVVLLVQFARLSAASRWVLHTDNVVDQARQIQINLLDMETGMRGYLIGGRDEFLEPYELAKPKLNPALLHLEGLTSTKPEQTARVQRLKIETEKWLRAAEERISARKNAGSSWKVLRAEGDSGKAIMDNLRLKIQDFISEENSIQVKRTHDFELAQQQLIMIILGFSLFFGLLLAYFSRRQLATLSKTYEGVLRAEEEQSVLLRTARQSAEKSSADIVEILEGMQDGFLETDANWQILRVNRVHEKVFSHSRETILGRNLWEVFPAAAIPSTAFWKKTQRTMAQREITNFQE